MSIGHTPKEMAEFEHHEARQEQREVDALKPKRPAELTPTQKIVYLIRQFECLKHKTIPGDARGNFDADRYEKISRPWSHGERQAALFVLAVWSGRNRKGNGQAFDLVDAVSVLGYEDREVITKWVLSPYYP